MYIRQTARYNMTFLTVSDSGWPGASSSKPACVPPCEDGLHPGGGNGTGWKGTLVLETNVQSFTSHTCMYVCISFSSYWYLSSSIDCANLDCANIHYGIQNEAI